MNTTALQDGLCEFRWHGRGGQGAISSAKILAAAAYLAGFKGVTSAPSFGAERRGAPVTASTRLSSEPIRIYSQVESPDVVVVLDDTLVRTAKATAGLKPGGWLIVNTPRDPDKLGVGEEFCIATADATGAAMDVGLLVSGVAMVNTAMLGAVAKATGFVSLDELKEAVAEAFSPKAAQKNFEVAKLTFQRTKIRLAAGRAAD